MSGPDESGARERLADMARAHDEAIRAVASQPESLLAAARLIAEAAATGCKVMTCGNGGSAADAQHLAAELVGRFEGTRMSLPCVALCVDPAVTTALANDYGYENVFAQQVTALGRAGDVLVCFTTSGTSSNVVAAAREARRIGLRVVAFVGPADAATELGGCADVMVHCHCGSTPRTQEAHGFAVHAVCELVRTLTSA